MSTQFPPSSPLLNVESEDIQPKGLLISAPSKINRRPKYDYPTPNPSSSIGDIPSEDEPVRVSAYEENKENIPPKQGLMIDHVSKKRAFTSPSSPSPVPVNLPISSIPSSSFKAQIRRISKVLIIDTSKDDCISIGRSTKLSKFGVNPHNKLVSRVHCQISYDKSQNMVELACKGWNGVNVTIPALVQVKNVSDKLYSVEPKKAETEKNDRVLFEDSEFTNFYILKGETVRMPAMECTVIDIRGEVIVIEFKAPEMEGPVKEVPAKEVQRKDVQRKDVPAVKKIQRREVAPAGLPKKVQRKAAKEIPTEHLPVRTQIAKAAALPVKKAQPKAATVKTQPKATIVKTQPKAEAVKISSAAPSASPIADSPAPSSIPELPPHKRIRKSFIREEEREELLQFEHLTSNQIQSVLRAVPTLDDLSHVLANHIAYSRLLQVPLTQLLALNPVKERDISRLQLRCILIHHIPCIGVIYRTGTDAAGLPLDEEYYYIPEKDQDKSRVMLVEELKGSASHLRSCRKTHKQYFWKRPKK
ncbi:DEKNAAC104235 [Brettanomyces naardenensis]|uniref:DEKNAAC104235 n=1 Tax=Brettanomyces naardenensis TaxID=13370 RepID=A0A448YQ99_BRENA|nr:DEKNAAC104235 [Brettanomyces naardenensis]